MAEDGGRDTALKVVVGTDGSELGARAVIWATAYAHRAGAAVDVRTRHDARDLIEASEEADLLVVGSPLRRGPYRLFRHSVGRECALYAHCPVVVVGPGQPETAAASAATNRIIVGVDGSGPSIKALEWGLQEAALSGATVTTVTAWSPLGWTGGAMPAASGFDSADDADTVLHQAADPAFQRYPNVQAERQVLRGHPGPALVDATRRAELLAVGSQGRRAAVDALLGSVSQYCLAHAECPVLVMRDKSRRRARA